MLERSVGFGLGKYGGFGQYGPAFGKGSTGAKKKKSEPPLRFRVCLTQKNPLQVLNKLKSEGLVRDIEQNNDPKGRSRYTFVVLGGKAVVKKLRSLLSFRPVKTTYSTGTTPASRPDPETAQAMMTAFRNQWNV